MSRLFAILKILIELVPLPVSHHRQSNADAHRRNHQNQNSTFQRLDHARTRSGRLRVTKRAILRKGKNREQ